METETLPVWHVFNCFLRSVHRSVWLGVVPSWSKEASLTCACTSCVTTGRHPVTITGNPKTKQWKRVSLLHRQHLKSRGIFYQLFRYRTSSSTHNYIMCQCHSFSFGACGPLQHLLCCFTRSSPSPYSVICKCERIWWLLELGYWLI